MSYLTSARKSDRNICLQLFDQWNESYQFFPTNLLSVQFLFGNSFQKYLAMYCFSCLNNFIKCICSCENSTLKDITLMSSLRSLVQVVKAPCIFFFSYLKCQDKLGSYLKCQDKLGQKLQKFVELCQSYT